MSHNINAILISTVDAAISGAYLEAIFEDLKIKNYDTRELINCGIPSVEQELIQGIKDMNAECEFNNSFAFQLSENWTEYDYGRRVTNTYNYENNKKSRTIESVFCVGDRNSFVYAGTTIMKYNKNRGLKYEINIESDKSVVIKLYKNSMLQRRIRYVGGLRHGYSTHYVNNFCRNTNVYYYGKKIGTAKSADYEADNNWWLAERLIKKY